MIPALLLAAMQVAGAPVSQDPLSDPPQVGEETIVQRVRPLPFIAASLWVVGGYDWTSSRRAMPLTAPPPPFTVLLPGPPSAFGGDVGGDLFFRVAGPIYLGGIIDYGFAGPNAFLVAGGARIAIADLALSGGFGYTNFDQGGPGAIAGADFAISSALALRLQGSWRHSSFTVTFPTPAEYRRTVWSLMGGLSLHL